MAHRQLQHGGGRQGQLPVGGVDAAMARRGRSADQLGNAEVQQAHADPHHVDEGIDGPHLMEMDLFGGMAMDGRLRLRQQGEHLQHLLPELRFKGTGRQLLAQIAPLAVGRSHLQGLHGEGNAPQATAGSLLPAHLVGA
jgi:hypothetical protein